MNILIKALSDFGQGFMFGLGFVLAAWAAYFGIQGADATAIPSPMSLASDLVPNSASTGKDFEFRDVEEIKQDGHTYFIGVIKNKNISSVSGVNIEVNLFKKEKFVDQYSSYMSGLIASGEERYFKIACGCKDNPPAEHDSYKIEVIRGY